MASLKEFLALADGADEVTFSVAREGLEDPKDVKFIDDYGISGGRNAEFFILGNEFGPTHVIHANGFDAAWEAWLDEQPTIPEDELIEAYGIIDDYREEYEKANPQPEVYPNPNGRQPIEVTETWWEGFKAACRKRLEELSGGDNPPELIEGYEYQANASGTGIVDVGHYTWMNEADPAEISFRIKTEENEDE